jgi:hypothetical protein
MEIEKRYLFLGIVPLRLFRNGVMTFMIYTNVELALINLFSVFPTV